MTCLRQYFDMKRGPGNYEYNAYPLTVDAADPLMAVMSSYCKTYEKTHGLSQKTLRSRDIAVLMLISPIFKISFAISPIKIHHLLEQHPNSPPVRYRDTSYVLLDL